MDAREARLARKDELSDRYEANRQGVSIGKDELVALLEQDGQLIEFKLEIGQGADKKYIVIVSDGSFLEILGKGPNQRKLRWVHIKIWI